jgi:hypothetical protein
MISRRIFAALALLCAFAMPAYAQKTKAQLSVEINATFPNNTVGFITPSLVRSYESDVLNSIMPTAPVVSGNAACFNGTTGLLQDCGSVPTVSLFGDCTVSSLGQIICLKTNGVPFGTMANQNASSVAITGGTITGMPTPVNPTDVTNKSYVDAVSAGLTILAPSTYATAAILPNTPTYANGTAGVGATLTAGANSTLTVDGTVAALNSVVLVNNQASAFQNGIYTVTNAGSGSAPWVLTRATYFNQSSNMLKGSYTFITAGTANINTAWVLAATTTTVGTTAVNFNKFSQPSGVNSLNSLSGSLNIAAGNGTSVSASGSSVTVGNNLTTVAIMDAAYGAKCNTVLLSSSASFSMTSGSNVLTGSGGNVAFSAADVGKSMWVPGAGASGAGLSTTISGFTSSTVVTLATNAATTISSLAMTQANPMVYGTDDTAAIQAAINATPSFGTLYINPIALSFPVSGCLIKQTGSTGVSLTVNHPINITGGGNLSALITDPTMGTTVTGIHALVSGVNWNGIKWSGFTLGTSANFIPFSRYGGVGIYFDATTAGAGGFLGVTVDNLRLGESSGEYSLLMDGVGSQGNRFTNNTIWGGLELNGVIDSNVIAYNRFSGASIFGVNVIMAGGNFQFVGNSLTAAGGFCLAGSSGGTIWPVIQDNYFEENSLTPPNYQHNAMVDIGCGSSNAVTGAQISGNIIANIVSSTTLSILTSSGASATTILNNFIANNTGRTAVTNNGSSTNCGPNHWQTSGTLTNGTGSFANACTSY